MDWPELKRLFDLVCDLPAAQRESLLERECSDPELRCQVTELLAESRGAAEFLQHLVIQDSVDLAEPARSGRAGERLGPYRIERELGRGGMGEVFLAHRDDREYDMLVAVKIVRRGLDLQEVLQRFRQERQILARLEHPNIARLLDGGSTADGLPYLVMEFVEGEPITDYCDSRRLSIGDRCRLMLAVCDAVRHAHSHLVVHRDLKPSNILVDSGGVPKLLDFGIAKLLDKDQAAGQSATLLSLPLTPDYASPEQLQGAPITTATDVYLLGAVLFELLSGRKPRAAADAQGEEAPRNSSAPLPRPSLAKPEWRRGLRGDLDNIVMRATHREPGHRYRSAQELADDLRRFLEHRPVLARPDRLRYRAGKWVRRSPVTAVALLLLILSVSAGLAGTLYQARRAERRFQQVRNLARVFVFDVYDQIAALPGATTARKTIIATALSYLENLSREAGGDAGVTRELGAAYLKIGSVQGDPVTSNLGDPNGAMQSYQRAESLLTGLKANDPATSKLLMSVNYQISVLQRSQGNSSAAVASTKRAREYASQVLARLPDDSETLAAVVELDVTMSRALRASGDLPGAERTARSAMVSAEKLAAGPSATAETRANLADAISNLGVLQGLLGDLDSAAASYRRLVEIREQMARADPQNVVFQRQLMVAYGHVGDILGFRQGENLGDFTGAAEALGEAVTIAEWLTRQDPIDEKARFDLASAKLRLGTVMLELHQATNGLRELQEAYVLNAPLLAKSPSNVLFQSNAITLESNIAQALAGTGRAEDGVRLARRALAEAEAGIARKITFRSQVLHSQVILAMVLAEAGRFEEASRLAASVGAALDADPQFLHAGWLRGYFYSSLAGIYRDAKQIRQAEASLRQSREVWSRITGGPALSALRQRELQRLDRELAALQ